MRLVYDGPGQQNMLFDKGYPFRPDWEAVLTPVVDALTIRGDIDGSALFAYGCSQAGYWVAFFPAAGRVSTLGNFKGRRCE
jgi:hypothetical protein